MRAGAAFDALTEETAKLTAVVDNTSDGIAMVDDSGRVRLWSQTMARMTGVDAGRLDQDLDSAPEVVRTLVAAAREGRTHADGTPAPVQVHLVRDDGEQLDVSVSTVRIREASASAHSDESGWVSILTVHDETRERRVERMKTDFVATISHELRTPITPIKGYAHLLATRADRVTPEKRAQALRVISDRADHLSRLVDDLLLASQASEGARLAVELGIEDLGEVVEQAVTSFPQMSRRISVTLPSEPVLVQCDRIRAVQCLANLIGNAEKYAPAGSPVEIRVSVSGLQAHVHVRDHGPGIPDQEHDKVFERFYRREDPFTMRTGGAGLGLHIARELAVAMGGGLTLRNPAEGSGAEFVLHLLTSEAPAVGSTQVASPLGGRGAPRPASPATEQGPDGTMDPADRQAAM
jgi:PAS domain S-box-containing protein